MTQTRMRALPSKAIDTGMPPPSLPSGQYAPMAGPRCPGERRYAVSGVLQRAERPEADHGRITHAATRAQWLILAGYLLAAVAMTWRLWGDSANLMQAHTGDIDQFAWFMRYDATAIAHGRLPALVTTAMNAPYGINLMSNTAFLLPGVLLTPVTLLAGPQTSLTVALTIGFAGSAASLFLVLRRWGASVPAAALGGAVYGFSPALVHNGLSHYQVQFVLLPPLMIDALLRIMTGRGSTARNGIWLGLLVAAQLFIGEEVLLFTAIAGTVLAVSLAASRPKEVLGRVRPTAIGLAAAAAAALPICAYPLWVQLHGAVVSAGGGRTSLSGFVTPSSDLLFHTKASAAAVAHTPAQGVYFSYLGWPLLITVLAATAFFWRNMKIRTAGITFLVLEWLSFDSHVLPFHGVQLPAALLPWYWLYRVPVLGSALPSRLPILADGAAAVVLAFSLDHARAVASNARGWRYVRAAAPVVAVAAVLPLIPLAYPAYATAPLPAGWQTVFARLHVARGASVMVVPVGYSHIPQPMRWQADTGEPSSMVGGTFIAADPHGQVHRRGLADRNATERYLDALWLGSHPRELALRRARADLKALRPAAVVAVTSLDSPLGRFLTRLLGPPTYHAGSTLAWRLNAANASARQQH
jgi:hypothetical protein